MGVYIYTVGYTCIVFIGVYHITIHCCFVIGRNTNNRLLLRKLDIYFGLCAGRMSRKLDANRVIRPASLSETARMSSCDAQQTRRVHAPRSNRVQRAQWTRYYVSVFELRAKSSRKNVNRILRPGCWKPKIAGVRILFWFESLAFPNCVGLQNDVRSVSFECVYMKPEVYPKLIGLVLKVKWGHASKKWERIQRPNKYRRGSKVKSCWNVCLFALCC